MDDGTNTTNLVVGFIVLGVLVFFYLLPGVVASANKHPQAGAIWVLDIFLGWSVIGWVGALVWACTKPQQIIVVPPALAPTIPAAGQTPAEQIAQFARLRDQGIISTDEFEAKKRQLLGLSTQ